MRESGVDIDFVFVVVESSPLKCVQLCILLFTTTTFLKRWSQAPAWLPDLTGETSLFGSDDTIPMKGLVMFAFSFSFDNFIIIFPLGFDG